MVKNINNYFILAILLIAGISAAFYVSDYQVSLDELKLDLLLNENSPQLSPITCSHYWDCPTGFMCNSGVCGSQRTCDKNSSPNDYPQCPDGQTCDITTGNCKEAQCYANSASCRSSPFSVCNEWELCVRKSCVANVDCPSDTSCVNGWCMKPQCDSYNECGVNKVCWNKLCLARECTINSQCGAGNVCDNGICESKQCSTNSECEIGNTCINGICKQIECSNDEGCVFGKICDGGICVAKFCNKNADCPGGNRYCVDGTCSIPQCEDINDCNFGAVGGLVCNGISCTNTCQVNSDCVNICSISGQPCPESICVEGVCCPEGICPNVGNINNEICNDLIDNDKDGYIDYADSSCVSQCIIPNKITTQKVGSGSGAPVLIKENSSIAGCCASSQCYIEGTGCVNAGHLRTIHSGSQSESSFCSVNSGNGVFCKSGYKNDGSGNCVQCTFETIQAQCSGKLCGVSNSCGEVCQIGSGCLTSGEQTCNFFKPCPSGQGLTCVSGYCR
ncbi:MAG TPA: hypothetical protein VI815_03275 [Candidatus Nanoarchaeia archaeon]|nr:hypothetical protein [Candidatus Nanoarchaeia archaeon]